MMNLQQSLSEDIRCEIPNHFLDKVQYVCVFDNCAAEQRLCCSYCKFRFHNQHIQSLVKISDFTNKVQKDGLMLNIQLQEKGKKSQLDQLYWQKIDKKIKDEIHYANMQLQGVFSNINAEVYGQIHQMNHQIDEKALGQSVFDLQTKVQRIINRPWSHQSNQAIDLMTKIYRGEKHGELLEDEYFISHRNLQTINNYFTSVHIKLEAFFKNIMEQIPLIFKESFYNINDNQSELLNIRRKEKDQTYPSIRTSSMRRDQKQFDGQNNSYNIYDPNIGNSRRNLMSTDINKSKQELDSQNNTIDLERQNNLDQASYNNQQQQRPARSMQNIMNNGQNSKPQSVLFRQHDQSQDRKNNLHGDSLDQYAIQMQNGNQDSYNSNNNSNQGYYPFGQQDMSQDPYIRYSKQLQQRKGNSLHHSNEAGRDAQYHRQNHHHNQNYNHNGEQYQGYQVPKSLNQIDDYQENSHSNFNNQNENSSPDRSEKRNNQSVNDSLQNFQFESPSKNKIDRSSNNQMSIILPSDANKDYVPQGSKIYLPSETQLEKQESHLRQPPQQKNFDHYKLPVQPAPYDLIQKPVESDQKNIKNNQPQKDWVAQKSLPENFAQKNKLKEIQSKYGFVKIPDTNQNQSRFGLMKSAKGEKYYEGEWLKGKRHGKGTFYDEDGSIYEGEWKDDQMTGKGRLILKDGQQYEGDLVNGIFDGKGYLKYQNGQDYIGEFKQGKLEGEGRKNWNNGAYYEGQFLNNQREGFGVFMWKNGSFYQGNFKNNQFNGNGFYQWQSGRLYEGEWVDGKMEGKGRDISDQGHVYEGQFKNDLKNGYGVYVVSQNKIYKGNWLDDKPHGEGAMIENGIEKKGIWEYGVKKN